MKKDVYKVAVVDDENEILSMIQRFLNRSEKYQVTVFSNPITAVETIDKSYDIVLLDIMMPQMNGLDALEKIMDKNPEQKVIMMTAYSTEEKIIQSDLTGACDYITKPFISLRDVENKILDALGI